MKYLALIYTAPNSGPTPGSEEHGQMMHAYKSASDTYAADGVMVAGEALEGVEAATSIRIRDGKMQTMDGPFAETKEHLGGFYMFDCANLDEAIKYAAMIPGAAFGTIEVRPVFDWTKAMPPEA